MPDHDARLEHLKTTLADRYALDRELGRGGMATVYLARDLKHDRNVAVKVIRPELASALIVERFVQEIRIAAQLQHPHILPVYDSGEADGVLYYVMPHVEGESLRARITRDRQLPLNDAMLIAQQAGAALSYAHSYGVVHRDIKPENILLSAGEAVVADFGIAKAIDVAGTEHLTATGQAVGTPAYMSPEQATGEKELDARSDIYALGCVLYEMLVGQPPFGGATAQAIMARHALDPVPSLRTVRDSIPEFVEHAVVKALAKVPADRFATIQEFVEALQKGEPSGAASNAAAASRDGAPKSRIVSDIALKDVERYDPKVQTVIASAWSTVKGRRIVAGGAILLVVLAVGVGSLVTMQSFDRMMFETLTDAGSREAGAVVVTVEYLDPSGQGGIRAQQFLATGGIRRTPDGFVVTASLSAVREPSRPDSVLARFSLEGDSSEVPILWRQLLDSLQARSPALPADSLDKLFKESWASFHARPPTPVP